MAISEAARADLYTGLRQLLGPERTETLMSAMRIQEIDHLATRSDVGRLGAQVDVLGARVDAVEAGLGRVEESLLGMAAKIDRLLYALVAGLVAIVAALAGVMVNL